MTQWIDLQIMRASIALLDQDAIPVILVPAFLPVRGAPQRDRYLARVGSSLVWIIAAQELNLPAPFLLSRCFVLEVAVGLVGRRGQQRVDVIADAQVTGDQIIPVQRG